MYFRARYFDTELGRFIGRDPLGTALQGDCPRVGINHGCADEYMTTWLRYHDGMNLYAGWFAMRGMVDPSGMVKSKADPCELRLYFGHGKRKPFEEWKKKGGLGGAVGCKTDVNNIDDWPIVGEDDLISGLDNPTGTGDPKKPRLQSVASVLKTAMKALKKAAKKGKCKTYTIRIICTDTKESDKLKANRDLRIALKLGCGDTIKVSK